jgi:hypothetical protein
MPSKSEVGSGAGIIAIVVVIVHTVFSPAQEGSSAVREGAQEKSHGAQEKSAAESAALEGPWIATRTFFNPPPKFTPIDYEHIKPLLSPEPLEADGIADWRQNLGIPDEKRLQSWAIVATVADPVHSRMQLFFDGQIQSIEKALAIHKWEFATQWLPWRDHADGGSSSVAEQRRERQSEREQEALPGVLVFRRANSDSDEYPSQVLFVLLVPETPTEGIAGDAFYAALHLARVLSSDHCESTDEPCQTGLLAPIYSGSFDSLTRFLSGWKDQRTIHPFVYGGSISSRAKADEFENTLRKSVVPFQFRSGIVNSDDYVAAFEKMLDDYHIPRDKAAYWVEDESGFGASFGQTVRDPSSEHPAGTSPESDAIPIYPFPRDISHLRSAYQEATKSSRNTVRNAAPTLDISLKDPSHGEDSIPVFSDTHTPVGQSAAISTITEEFSREGKRMVFIVAANTLDSLLLARFVRTESPNTRVVIGDADTLFIPAASQESLAGTLFLSTYPMFILGQEWLTRTFDNKHGEVDRHLIFPSASHQGLFNVTQLLLAGIGADKSKIPGGTADGDCLYGYRPLASPVDGAKPGLWLLTLTHYGFLPVDWHSIEKQGKQEKQGEQPGEWFEPRTSSHCDTQEQETKSATLEQLFPLDLPPFDWYLCVAAMSAVIFAVCIWRLRAGETDVSARWFLSLFGAGLSLTMAQWILLLPAWRVIGGLDTHEPTLWGWVFLIPALLALLAPVAIIFIVIRRSPGGTLAEKCRKLLDKSAHPSRTRSYAAVISTVFVSICVEWAWANGGIWTANTPNALLFRMRATQLSSESSPALPLVLLSLVFCFGFAVYFFRYSESGAKGSKGRPDPRIDDPFVAEIDKWIAAPFSLANAEFRRRMTICASLVTVVMLIAYAGMFGFEHLAFNIALYTALAVVLFALAAACYDLFKIRHSLLGFLERLELEDKETFERVTAHWPKRRLIWIWKSVSDDFFASHLAMTVPQSSDYLALHVCRYVVYVVRQMQRLAWSIGFALVMLILVLTAYSTQSPQLVGRIVAVLFIAIGALVVWVFATMEKNWVVSRIDRTEPGELNFEFWLQATAVVAVPLVGVLVHLFPSIGGFMSSWVAPSLQALK